MQIVTSWQNLRSLSCSGFCTQHVAISVNKAVKSQRSRVNIEDSRLLTLNNRIANS
ncbi:hypothetical protein [Nodularia sp. UHCC 0506]|uniref:hypothetical protein n=1 Tax=Nodularia sp. UHCC 0506 TaxID=3110243 RepID=UPI002B1FBBF5|nr:hypothetical protein [Nodularia sp. UHCC 0506]MEA5513886.1 hypothetical protein [Nodularia sp. UHCC 0506]